MSVQQTIIKGIKDQLFFNNYLVLPGFGGFVLKSSPTHFSSSGGVLVPPSKTVSFNVQLKQNDGILAIWLQNILGCTANEALNHLNEFSEFCSGILAAKRRLTLEGIGFFYLDFENNICFEPQQDVNFLTKSFGLGPLTVKVLETETAPEQKKEPVFVDRLLQREEPVQQALPKSRRNYSKFVNPVLFTLIFISFLGLLVTNSKIDGQLRASLFGGDSKSTYQPLNYPDLKIETAAPASKAYVTDANGIAIVELENEKIIAVKVLDNKFKTPRITHSKSKYSKLDRSDKFEIVLGCFTVRENAQRMINKLSAENIAAELSGKNAKGMYVVSNGSFDTKEEAIRKLRQIKTGFPNAWIKKGE